MSNRCLAGFRIANGAVEYEKITAVRKQRDPCCFEMPFLKKLKPRKQKWDVFRRERRVFVVEREQSVCFIVFANHKLRGNKTCCYEIL